MLHKMRTTQYSAVAIGASAKRSLPSGSRTDASIGLHAQFHAEAGPRCHAAADSDAEAKNAVVANVADVTNVTAEAPPPRI